MSVTINTYLCNKKIPAVRYPDQRNNLRMRWSGNVLEAYLVPFGCDPTKVHLEPLIIPEYADLIACMADMLGDAVLDWSRRVNLTMESGGFESRRQYITVELRHPSVPCWWHATYLYVWRDMSEEQLQITVSYSEGGMIPLDGSKSGVYMGSAGKLTQFTNSQTAYVPGELLQVKWELKVDDQYFNSPVAGAYFATPVFTGGKVADKENPEGALSVLYTVDIQGYERDCVPTDFANYQIGDWVFVIKQTETEAYLTNREEAYTKGDAELDPPYDPEEEEEEGEGEEIPAGSDREEAVFILVNEERTERSLPRLQKNSLLMSAAEKHLQDMISNDFFSHTGSDGSTPRSRILNEGYPSSSTTAENLAKGYTTAQGAVAGWMNSQPHYENIVNGDFVETGIAVGQNNDDYWLYVQVFGATYVADAPDMIASNPYRVFPVKVNNLGNATGAYETLEFNMMSLGAFETFFESTIHNAVIVQIHEGDLAKVNIEGLGPEREDTIEYDNIPFFYHCEYSNTISGGSDAFGVGDEVLILNPGGDPNPMQGMNDLKVIAHKDGVRKCGSDNVLIISEKRFSNNWYFEYAPIYAEDGTTIIGYPEPEESGKALVWDIDNGRLCAITDVDGSMVDQPVNFYKLANLLQMQVNGQVHLHSIPERLVYASYEDPEHNESYGIYNELEEDWYTYFFYLEKNELFPSGSFEGPRAIYEKLRLFPSTQEGYEIQHTLHIEDTQLGNQPVSYYTRIEDPVDVYPWELFTDSKLYYWVSGGMLLDIPDVDLADMYGRGIDSQTGEEIAEADWLVNQKNPEHENFHPHIAIGRLHFPYIKCSGDTDEYGCACFIKINAVYDNSTEAPHTNRYFSYTPSYAPIERQLHWYSIIPESEVVIHDIPPDSDPIHPDYILVTADGYDSAVSYQCGLLETEEVALAYEYFDWNVDAVDPDTMEIQFNDRFFIFKIYQQENPEDPEEGYKLSNFTEIPNMEGLKTVVDNSLNIETQMHLVGPRVHGGGAARNQRIPIISFYKLNYDV